jgi:hypothetical protein
MYDDDFIPIFERMHDQGWYEENKRLRMKDVYKRNWRKHAITNRKCHFKTEANRFEEKRMKYCNQFCQDNKFISSKKLWRFLRSHEIHLYNDNKKLNFNSKT